MSPKKRILSELRSALDRSPEAVHVRPPSLPGFAADPEGYQTAVNDLLRLRLVEGRRDAAGHMTIALNEHRRADIERMLRPVWTRASLWAVGATLLAAASLFAF